MSPSKGATNPHRIVVVGGGAAGLELVTRLGHRYASGGAAEVTLIERARTHLWKPLLHAVAAGSLAEEERQQVVHEGTFAAPRGPVHQERPLQPASVRGAHRNCPQATPP